MTTTHGTLTVNPDGSAAFAPDAVTPPAAFFPRATPSGWKVALREDFAGKMALPSTCWPYSGTPGGTSGCKWAPSQLTYGPDGVTINTRFDGTNWLSGGIGTYAKAPAPFIMRVYETLKDCNIDGLNHINLAWCDPWIMEIDFREAEAQGSKMGTSYLRIHDGSTANVIPPIKQADLQDLNPHCYEVWVASGSVQPFTDGVGSGQIETIPAASYAKLTANPHWLGVQSQVYNLNAGPKTATSKRVIRGIEILVPV